MAKTRQVGTSQAGHITPVGKNVLPAMVRTMGMKTEGSLAIILHRDKAPKGKATASITRNASGSAPPLDRIAKELRQEHGAAVSLLQDFWGHARRCGELLIAAKKQTGHGRYEAWVTSNTSISLATAQRYVTIAKHWSRAEASSVRDLPIAAATKLLPKYSGQELERAVTEERAKITATTLQKKVGTKVEGKQPPTEDRAQASMPPHLPVWAKPSNWEDDIALNSIGSDIAHFLGKAPWVLYAAETRRQLVEKFERIRGDIEAIVNSIRKMDATMQGVAL